MIVSKESLEGFGILEKEVGCDESGIEKGSEYAKGPW